MNAVILVGGWGTRLRPLTYAVPKSLIPVVNRPLITHLLGNLQRHGVDRIVFAGSAEERRLEAALGDGAGLGLNLSYSYESEPLGSGLAVKQAAQAFDGAFFVCNGDVLNDLDLASMAARHRERAAVMSVFLAPVDEPSAYGIADLDASGRIKRFVEKPPPGQTPSNWANAGTWLFEPEVLEQIPDQKLDGSIERLVMPSLIAAGRLVLGYTAPDAYWIDVGTPERYIQVHSDILSGRFRTDLSEAVRHGPLLGAGCQVAADAHCTAEVLLGSGCRVQALVRVAGPSVIGDNAVIGERVVLERSILWDGVEVGAGAIIRDSVLGAGCRVGAGAILEGALLASGARVLPGVHLPPGASLGPNEVAG